MEYPPMEYPSLDTKRITSILQTPSYSGKPSWQCSLDQSLGSTSIHLFDEKVALPIWQSFLSLPHVQCFQKGNVIAAYNFEKIEAAWVAAHWGCFVFAEENSLRSIIWLETQRKGCFRQAFFAYRTWLQTNFPHGQENHSLLSIYLESEDLPRACAQVEDLFAGIEEIAHLSEELILYRWAIPSHSWLNEAQLQALGRFEHIISVSRMPPRSLETAFKLSLSYSSLIPPEQGESTDETVHLLAPTQTKRRKLPKIVMAGLLIALLGGWWWLRSEDAADPANGSPSKKARVLGTTARGSHPR